MAELVRKKTSALPLLAAGSITGKEFFSVGYQGSNYRVLLEELKTYIGVSGGGGGSVDLTSVLSDVVPFADNLYTLGAEGNHWKRVYVNDIDSDGDLTLSPGGNVLIPGSDLEVGGSIYMDGQLLSTRAYVDGMLSGKASADALSSLVGRVSSIEADYVDVDALLANLGNYYTKKEVDGLLGETGGIDLSGFLKITVPDAQFPKEVEIGDYDDVYLKNALRVDQLYFSNGFSIVVDSEDPSNLKYDGEVLLNTYNYSEYVYSKDEVHNVLNDYVSLSLYYEIEDEIIGKADKATTLAGYGITDAYTKKEVDAIEDNLSAEITDLGNTLAAGIDSNYASITALQKQVDAIVIPGAVTESTVSGWGFTKNAGTITGIKMNGASIGTSGVVDLGTVLTSHQSLDGYINSVGEEGSGNVVTGYRKSGKSLVLQKGLSVYSKDEVEEMIGGMSLPSLDGYVTTETLTESLNNLANTYLSFRGGGTVSGSTTFSGGLSVQNSLTLLGVEVAAGSSGLTFGGKIPMYSGDAYTKSEANKEFQQKGSYLTSSDLIGYLKPDGNGLVSHSGRFEIIGADGVIYLENGGIKGTLYGVDSWSIDDESNGLLKSLTVAEKIYPDQSLGASIGSENKQFAEVYSYNFYEKGKRLEDEYLQFRDTIFGARALVDEYDSSVFWHDRSDAILSKKEMYDVQGDKAVPIKHPDLSTQPSILSQKFAGEYVYEQMRYVRGKGRDYVETIVEDAFYDKALIVDVTVACESNFGAVVDKDVTVYSYNRTIVARNFDVGFNYWVRVAWTANPSNKRNNYYYGGY